MQVLVILSVNIAVLLNHGLILLLQFCDGFSVIALGSDQQPTIFSHQ